VKKIIITQSNYIPWKGYFDGIHLVDEIILYDDMQYTRRDWRNRNQIKTPQGLQWLTIPVEVKGKFFQKINETRISEADWGHKHWLTLKHNYSKSPYWQIYAERLEQIYHTEFELLSEVNHTFITQINTWLGIETPIRWSSEFSLAEDRNERLIEICKQTGATDYFSGPAAKAYMDLEAFRSAGIAVHWFNYSGYSEYPQLYGDFTHGVSVLDLLFQTGQEATRYLKSFTKPESLYDSAI
jgi:hypothetical protein